MDPRVTRLHFIVPIANVQSVLTHGILSHTSAAVLDPTSVADPAVQQIRDGKTVPRGLALHDYANLYFNPRNPMMYKRQAQASKLCVLNISTDVLRVRGVVLTDCNASSRYARYLSPNQWRQIEFDDVFARDWTHPGNLPRYLQHKSRMCAEVLVPHRVAPQYIVGAYVVSSSAEVMLRRAGPGLAIQVEPDVFFR